MTPIKKKLLIDMDGVLADIYGQFIKYEFNDIGLTQSLTDLTGKLEREAFKYHDKYVNSENFFYSAIPIEDSIETVRRLNDVYEVYIVSSAMQFPLSLTEKINWLTKHFPFLSWKQIVFCGTKEIVYGDIMIDDHFKNLDTFQGQTILFTQPHNVGKPTDKHKRVNNWKEIETILL
ncbi:MAG: 5'(3')-deoxyribonucleotidase [Bacteroidetes bacterium]|nr:5'(3')-deoxyribonucleotidase [Bacteroidota bacterium]